MEGFNKENNEVASGVDSAKKGKGKLVAGITAGAIAVVAGGGAIAYASSDFVKNQVKLTFSSPANYYAWVSEKNTNEFASQISEQYRVAIDEMKNGQTSSVSFKYEPSQKAKDMLVDSGMPDEMIEILQNTSDITLGIDASEKDSISNGNAFLALNSEKLVTMDMAVDSSTMDMLFRVPELSEQWVDFNASYIYGINEEAENYKKYMSDPESLITPEELEAEIVKYSDLWNECISDVELEKKADVAIADITVNYTVVSITIDEAKGMEIAEKFINTAKEDEVLKGIVVDKLAVVSADEYIQELDDALAEIKEDSDGSSDETVTINTYIDPTGCIRGISFDTTKNDYMEFIIGKDGENIRGSFSCKESGTEEASAVLSLTENDGKYTGNIDINADDETFSIEFINIGTVNEEKGYVEGMVTLVFPADAEMKPLTMTLSSDGAYQTISVPLDFDDTDYGTISMSISADNGAEPVMPDKSGAFVIDEDTDAEISDYVSQETMETFLKNVFVKMGFAEDISQEYAEEIGDEIYYTYNYDDYYDDWDYDDYDYDYDYDWDDEDYDYEYEEDDYSDSYDSEDDPYYNDMVIAEDGQAYLCIIDNNMTASYGGYNDSLAYNATLADITKNGTYTVKVTADSDGYRNRMKDEKPDGIMILGVEVCGLDSETATMEVKSVKIDGKEYEITGTSESYGSYGTVSLMIYSSFADDENAVDLSGIGEWTDIEVTFEVTGM